MCTNLQEAAPNRSRVASVLGGNRLKTDCRYEFSPDFSNSFSNLLSYSYKMREAAPDRSGVTSILGGNKLKTNCRYEFLPDFSNSFFNLLSYSYKMRIPICERLRLTVPELQGFW